MSKMKPDSPIWTNPADPGALSHLEWKGTQEELEQLFEKVRNDPEHKARLEKRRAPYSTKVTWESLHRMLD